MSDLGFQTSRDIVIGLADGAIITSCVVSGLTGAHQPAQLIINAGCLTALCGALVFSFSKNATEKTARKEFNSKTQSTPGDIADTLGLDDEFRRAAGSEMEKDRKSWEDRVSSETSSAFPRTALAIGIAFLAGGLAPVSAFFFLPPEQAFKISLFTVGAILLICGFFKALLAQRNRITGALIQFSIGALAVVLCFFMGGLLGF